MRRALTELKSPPYERLVAYYVAYSESDFFNDRSQVMQDGIHRTLGMFQQSDRWWGTREQILDISHATASFVEAFRKSQPIGDPTIDAHTVQQWHIPDKSQFWAAPETLNYTGRLGAVKDIMADPLYFTNRKK